MEGWSAARLVQYTLNALDAHAPVHLRCPVQATVRSTGVVPCTGFSWLTGHKIRTVAVLNERCTVHILV